MKITGISGELPQEEIQAYRQYVEEHHPGHELTGIHIDGDFVLLEYKPIPFERIRRITGYLVGTTERWNNAKRAELADRVKHGTGEVEKI